MTTNSGTNSSYKSGKVSCQPPGITQRDIDNHRESFAVFDGSNPSSQWADFIIDDEESGDEFGYGTADETTPADTRTGSEEKLGSSDVCLSVDNKDNPGVETSFIME
eukprot:CAMPEP_0183313464 /NCGR_PEP_ID=MMETSP0160_2-20130417/45393_1 /TAXON_ID=2839 ORGANISM="Odontella Sinensis, Strain Grunow 1884" /NCGR_SAMPLE_ID=MMETSP0160_2 /ASSEMBLY_ACC=CAM_ASM_000250 /LENGTH=106 /DNA_ID=CAMNT_0025478557 /DNA_START=360 /DNA_END=677 /DNA_ORIENTATION=-